MTSLRAVASWLMHAAAIVAPRDKAEWTQGMRVEFSVLEGDGAALSWAIGCFGAALGWRLKAEAFYVLALIAIFFAFEPITWKIMSIVGRSTEYPFWKDDIVRQTTIALITLLLCLYRPRRIIFTSPLIVLCVVAASLAPLVMVILNHPDHPTVRHHFPDAGTTAYWLSRMAWADLSHYAWTSFFAAALAWVSHRLWRKLRSAS